MGSGKPSLNRFAPILAAIAIVVAGIAAYANSFGAPFVFDDDEAIVNNPSIRDLPSLREVLLGGQDAGMTGNGRPVLNLTLAVNHALGGYNVWGYHAVNVLIHVLAALTLFSLVRQTLHRPPLAERWGAVALPAGFFTALLWLVHPLQTESVTYIVQRAESLAGLLCLLTLWLFMRGTKGPRKSIWLTASTAACLLGMATKEVMVAAPLLVLLYDRTFVAGSFRAAWQSRGRYYLALVATWIPLAWLVARTGGRGDSAGFDAGVSEWTYLLTQCDAIVHYLRLAFWPHPQVLDYGNTVIPSLTAVWWQAVLLSGLVLATAWGLWRRPPWGFAGAWLFVLLAPSSSFVPVATQTMAEHRMYLALAAPVLLVVLGMLTLLGRRTWWVLAGATLVLLPLTISRNAVYASRLTLWADTVGQRPGNPRAHNNLGIELAVAGRGAEATQHFEEALRLQPNLADARNNLANELLRQGRLPEAIAHYETALRTKPDDVLALGNLGVALLQAGRLREAMARYEQLLALDPDDASAQGNLGYLLLESGRPADALPHYERAALLQPGDATALLNLAVALTRTGRPQEAAARCDEALQIDPHLAAARQLRGQLQAGPAGSR
jgi:Flp pilus assembly protein TadD